MTGGANVYGVLLLFSFICGAMLGALSDFFRMIRYTLFNKEYDHRHSVTERSATLDIRLSQRRGKRPDSPPPEFINSAHMITAQYTKALKSVSIKSANNGKFETVVTAIFDICFAVLSAITLILLVFQLNLGELRGFVPVITALGFAAYRSTLSRPLTAVTITIIRIIQKVFQRILKMLLHPILKLIQASVIFAKHKQHARYIKNSRKSYAKKLKAKASKGFGVISK